jgi:hypothetical protein
MTIKRRVEALEMTALRRQVASYVPLGWTLEAFLDEAIAWLEQPMEARQASMPGFTEAEHAEMASWLPKYRRLRWRSSPGGKPNAR